jgi:hypothetical protein
VLDGEFWMNVKVNDFDAVIPREVLLTNVFEVRNGA